MNALLFTQEEQDNKQMTESLLQPADLPSPHFLSHTVHQDIWEKFQKSEETEVLPFAPEKKEICPWSLTWEIPSFYWLGPWICVGRPCHKLAVSCCLEYSIDLGTQEQKHWKSQFGFKKNPVPRQESLLGSPHGGTASHFWHPCADMHDRNCWVHSLLDTILIIRDCSCNSHLYL